MTYHSWLTTSSGINDAILTFPDQPEKGTIAQTKCLFFIVKAGGALVIGNFCPNNPRDLRFPMEYIYDWQPIYRDEKEMFEFTQAIPAWQIEAMTIDREPLGINYFLKIEKIA